MIDNKILEQIEINEKNSGPRKAHNAQLKHDREWGVYNTPAKDTTMTKWARRDATQAELNRRSSATRSAVYADCILFDDLQYVDTIGQACALGKDTTWPWAEVDEKGNPTANANYFFTRTINGAKKKLFICELAGYGKLAIIVPIATEDDSSTEEWEYADFDWADKDIFDAHMNEIQGDEIIVFENAEEAQSYAEENHTENVFNSDAQEKEANIDSDLPVTDRFNKPSIGNKIAATDVQAESLTEEINDDIIDYAFKQNPDDLTDEIRNKIKQDDRLQVKSVGTPTGGDIWFRGNLLASFYQYKDTFNKDLENEGGIDSVIEKYKKAKDAAIDNAASTPYKTLIAALKRLPSLEWLINCYDYFNNTDHEDILVKESLTEDEEEETGDISNVQFMDPPTDAE